MQSPNVSNREYLNAWIDGSGKITDSKPYFPEQNSYWFTDDEWDRINGKIIVVDMIRKVYPSSIMEDLASVQPMGSQHGHIFAVKPKWTSSP